MGKLGKEAQALFNRIITEYAVKDPAGEALVRLACESLQLIRECEAIIDKEGIFLRDKYDRSKVNPACTVLKDAKSQFMQAIKMLQLEDFNNPVGRPPSGAAHTKKMNYVTQKN